MFRIKQSTKGFTLVEIMIVVAIIGILVAIAVPGFIKARTESRAKACQENQAKVEGAIQQWAMENNKDGATVPTDGDIYGASLYLPKAPTCPSTDTEYTLVGADDTVTCPTSEAGHDR